MTQPVASPVRRLIYDLSYQELANLMARWGEPTYRARQIWEGLYRSLWNDPFSSPICL